MPVSIVCTSRKEWARVGLLHLLGVVVARWTTLVWNQNVFSLVECHLPTCWERSTNCSCSQSILLLTYDRCDLHLQERPIVDKLLHLDCFQSFAHGRHDLARIGHGFLGSPSLCIPFFKLLARKYSLFPGSFPYLWPWGLPFLMTYSGIWKKVQCVFNGTWIGHCFS